MKGTHNYCCVNCQLDFGVEDQYISHYRSEHHRYNIKRKLIGLAPLSLHEFQLQFQDDKTSKQSTQQELHCEICSKKFMSAGTYHTHLKSKRHQSAREKIKSPDTMSVGKSESSSDFSVIGAEKAEQCMFCHELETKEHLKSKHNFPPFEQQCTDVKGLMSHIRSKIKEGLCIYCESLFHSEESVRQHMDDLGHSMLNLEDFSEYEKYYLWKIEQSSSEEEQELTEELHSLESSVFEQLKHPTLEDLEQKRLGRIKYTTTGAIINGKQVGYRYLKKYYKQYLGRVIENPRLKYQPAIEHNDDWKAGGGKITNAPPKIAQMVNSR